MKTKITLTERELKNLIRNIIIESSDEVEEGWLSNKLRDVGRGVKKITTGKDVDPKEYFIDDILDIESEIKHEPDKFIDSDNWDMVKRDLISKASDSNHSGKLTKKMTKSGKYKVIYEI